MASAIPFVEKTDPLESTRTLSILVENRFGVLSRIAGLFSARGYNIESLTVARTADSTLSRITMVVRCEPLLAQQILRQVEKLPNAVEAADLTDTNCVERELVLVRVHAKEGRRTSLLTEAEIFRARVVTATPENYVFEVTGDSGKIEAFLDVVRPYGIDEMVRTGQVALRRNLHSRFAPETVVEEDPVEASR
ncbi:MAG: acetolactate synthase small subunit [Acidobacteriota bacterium]|jgi:acetolactate synthase-1/3 small subunit|nr:acetolactate synthase small subunit [Acidobacteriota bacterium]